MLAPAQESDRENNVLIDSKLKLELRFLFFLLESAQELDYGKIVLLDSKLKLECDLFFLKTGQGYVCKKVDCFQKLIRTLSFITNY